MGSLLGTRKREEFFVADNYNDRGSLSYSPIGSSYSLSPSLNSANGSSVEFENVYGQSMMTCPRRWFNHKLSREASRELLRSLPDKEDYHSNTIYFVVRNSSHSSRSKLRGVGLRVPIHDFTMDICMPHTLSVVSYPLRNSKENIFSEEMSDSHLVPLVESKLIDFRSLLTSRHIFEVPRVHLTLMRDDFIFRLVYHTSTEESDVYQTLENFDKTEDMLFELFWNNRGGEVIPHNLRAVHIRLQSDGIETESIKFQPADSKIYIRVKHEYLKTDLHPKCLVEREGDEMFTFQWRMVPLVLAFFSSSEADRRFDFSMTVEWKGEEEGDYGARKWMTEINNTSDMKDVYNGRCNLNNMVSLRQLDALKKRD